MSIVETHSDWLKDGEAKTILPDREFARAKGWTHQVEWTDDDIRAVHETLRAAAHQQ